MRASGSEAPPVDTKLQPLSPRPATPAPVSDRTSPRQVSPSPWPLEQPEPATQFALRDYWRLIHGRRRAILWVVVSSLLATTVYNYLRVPTYRAKATIQIDREEPNIAQLDNSLPKPKFQAAAGGKVLIPRQKGGGGGLRFWLQAEQLEGALLQRRGGGELLEGGARFVACDAAGVLTARGQGVEQGLETVQG